MKILLSGPSGSGKTTLARHISSEYGIPFVQGSTKIFWDEFNITSHSEIIQRSQVDIDWGLRFQYRCLEYRAEEFSKHKDLVSDRGIIDNIVYFLMQNAPKVSTSITQDYIDTANKFLLDNKDVNHIFLGLPIKLENDGKRVDNMIYQKLIESVFEHVISHHLVDTERIDYINNWDWIYRTLAVDQIIKSIKDA